MDRTGTIITFVTLIFSVAKRFIANPLLTGFLFSVKDVESLNVNLLSIEATYLIFQTVNQLSYLANRS